MAELEARKQAIAARMPTEQDAIVALFEAYERLKELGWKDPAGAPVETEISTVSLGSTGIHCAQRWKNGSFWVSSHGDLWPSKPILFRERRDTDPQPTSDPGVCTIIDVVDDDDESAAPS